MAGVLAGGATAVLSHRSAGQLWGILPRTDAPPEITRPKAARLRAGIVVHRAVLPRDEITVIDDIPATGLARTVLDLAARSSRSQVEQMLNEAEVRSLTDRLSIPALLERYPRRAGSVVLKQIFRERSHLHGITKKELERRFKRLLSGSGLPRPRHNAPLAVDEQFFEIDCLWTEQRLVVELDGRAVHGTPRAFEHDRERDRLLVANGWRVVRITWLQLRDEAPAVLADLRRLLR